MWSGEEFLSETPVISLGVELDWWAPGRQLIIDTITKLGPAIEASLGWGTVQNNIKFHIGDINNPNFNI